MKTETVRLYPVVGTNKIYFGSAVVFPNVTIYIKYQDGDEYELGEVYFDTLIKNGILYTYKHTIIENDTFEVHNWGVSISTSRPLETFYIEYETPVMEDLISFAKDKGVMSMTDTIKELNVFSDSEKTIQSKDGASFNFVLPAEMNVLLGVTEIVLNTHGYETFNYTGLAIESIVNDGENLRVFVTNFSDEAIKISEPKVRITYL